VTEAFAIFREHWDSTSLRRYKSAKAIFIDNKNQAFGIYDIPAEKQIRIDNSDDFTINSANLFDAAKEFNASTIIIAENFLSDEIYIDGQKFDVISNLKKEAKSVGVKVADFMSISSHGYSTLKKKKKELHHA
jgi:DNA repair protein RadC